MPRILTSDEFVAGVMSVLALKGTTRFVLSDTELDERFERAYERLLELQVDLDVVPNFTFYLETNHGDSGALRDTLLSARDKKILAFRNPTLHVFEIMLNRDRAENYIKSSSIPKDFWEAIAAQHFSDLADKRATA